jgi:catechol 2,3-dioxygenase-like lactoylglutathione lyase family enzyme
MANPAPPPSKPTSFKGINHLKLPCHSITKSHDFYTQIFPFIPLPQYNHYTPQHAVFAKMFTHEPTKLIVEVRYSPADADAQKGWDPITWGVGTRKDLEEWGVWLDSWGVKRSRIFTGIKGWVMGCEDPDGRIVRLYVEDEEHEWTDHPDKDEYWLGNVQGDPEANGDAK